MTAALGLWQPSAVAAVHRAAMTSTVLAVYNVRDYGAKGDGSTNDTPAIQEAVDAANAAGGGTVQFPSPGNYKSKNTLHMKSNVTLQVDTGAVLQGSRAPARTRTTRPSPTPTTPTRTTATATSTTP
jgi:polygalacturonase